MAHLFWLTDEQWKAIDPLLPRNRPGARRVDDRRVISGIVHVLKSGCRWQDCPPGYGPPTTIYNRFHRWSGQGVWQALLAALIEATPGDAHFIDSTSSKAHRCAAGGKGGLPRRRSVAPVAAERPKSTRSSIAEAAPSPSR